MKHLQIRIRGKVQGVCFRAGTERKAKELGLVGFVLNEEDGSVYVEAEGSPDALQALIKWCQSGPLLASVEGVEVHEGEVKGYEKFVQIR